MTLAQLRALAVATGFADPDTAAAVAMAESGGDPHAQGDPRGPNNATPNGTSTSFGLWQIHQTVWTRFDQQSLLDPNYNAQAALIISRTPHGWDNWTTYTTSDPTVSYKRFMPTGYKAKEVVKFVAGVAALSVLIVEVRKHGGIANTVYAARRAVARYV
jgi:hypothetical protein